MYTLHFRLSDSFPINDFVRLFILKPDFDVLMVEGPGLIKMCMVSAKALIL
jgi:hypothetical protein